MALSSAAAIDRIAPADRASCRTRKTGVQTWRDLLFVHWEVPVAPLRALLPGALSIDTYEGRAYVGVVPFTMHRVRFGPVPIADFLETNVRTYVHAAGVPGVWFFSLDAASALAAWGGRFFYGLPYFHAHMEWERRDESNEYRLTRTTRWGRPGASLDAAWTTDEPEHEAAPDSLEAFLTARFALYAERRGRGVFRIRVHHGPWPLRRARLRRLSTSLVESARLEPTRQLDAVLASPRGVAVETFAPEPL